MKRDDGKPGINGHLLCSICFLLSTTCAVALLFFSRRMPAFGEWYARHVFPLFPLTLGRLTSFAPFSLFEFLVLGLLGAMPLLVLWKCISWIRQRKRRRDWWEEPTHKPFSLRFLQLLSAVSIIFLLFVLTCGVNYNRETFAEQNGLDIREVEVGELRQLYRLLADRALALEKELPPAVTDVLQDTVLQGTQDADGEASVASQTITSTRAAMPITDNTRWGQPLGQAGIHQTAIQAMETLSLQYPGLISYYPAPKAVYFSELLSRCQLGGFFSNYTMEANYNRHMPEINIPFTICHELAHISGFAREDEANFVAYLACEQSGDPYFRYSGLTYALRYTLQGLSDSLEGEEYLKLCEGLPEWIWRDLYENRMYWTAYEGRTAEIYQKANDTFLKANNQDDGIQSYARMLYLLLAYYRDSGGLEQYSDKPEPILPDIFVSADELHSPHVILADRETGTILFAKDAATRAEPASVTKIWTTVTALALIEDLDDTVVMHTRDFTDLYRLNASLSGFKVGERVSYRDLLYTLMLISGCDSAYALANNLCGSIPAFADVMNEKVAALGLSDSFFVDPSGLTAPGHYMSAEDTVKLLDYALDVPGFREIFEARHYVVPPTNMTPEEREINNTFFSRLARDYEGGYLENGAVLLGGKTGFTNAAGLCLATVSTYEGREYITVVFGGPGNNRSPAYNFMDTVAMLDALRNRTLVSRVY